MSARWFTDPAAAGPASIRPSFTEYEKIHFAAIIEFACNPANHNWENLRCLDAAGTRMHDMSIGVKGAPVTDVMNTAIERGRGVRQWHNHPSQDSLSHYDWNCAGCSPHLEILALNKRGSIFVGRIADWDDRLHHVLSWLPRLFEDLERHMNQRAKQGGLDVSLLCALSEFTGHVLNSALAACSPVRYAYYLMPDDQGVIDACSQLRIVEDGRNYALAAIKQKLAEAPAVQNGAAGSGLSTPDSI